MNAVQRRQFLQLMVDRLPAAALGVGPRDEVVLCTGAASRLLGLAGPAPARLRDLPRNVAASLAELLTRARSAEGELHGEQLEVELSIPRRLRLDAIPLRGDGPAAVLFLLHDEHEQLATCAETLSEVTHELRTPLSSLQSTLQLVASGAAGALNPDQNRFLTMSVRAAERMGRLVDGLLDLSLQGSGRLALARQPTALHPLLVPALEQMRVLAEGSQRTLDWDLEEHAQAHVHSDRWLEVVDNLVSNALKYTPRGGRIRVSLKGDVPIADAGLQRVGALLDLDVRGALFTVQDDGPGLAATASPERVTQSPQPPMPGRPRSSGLGLSITRALVRAHDGHVDWNSSPGNGTTVRVWIPAHEPAARLMATASRLDAALRGGSANSTAPAPRGSVLVAELEAPGAGDPSPDLEASLRRSCPGARWVGALTPAVGVAAVSCMPESLAWGWPPAPQGGLEPQAEGVARLGWAAAPLDASDAGTLLAVAIGRARVPLVAIAREPHHHAPKEEGRG